MAKNLSKADELAWLDKAIAELGPDTYLGDTFADQRDAIADDIRNDILPLNLKWLRDQEGKILLEIGVKSRRLRDIDGQIEAANRSLEVAQNAEKGALHRRDTYVADAVADAREALQNLRSLADLY